MREGPGLLHLADSTTPDIGTASAAAHATIKVHAMIARYTRPEMGAIWTDQKKYECWLEVELAASQSLAELGEVPEDAAAALRSNAGFDLRRIQEIEREVRHDVIAFTTAVAETMKAKGAGDASRWLHYGLTSNDVVDTAQALQIKAASALIAKGLDELSVALKGSALRYKHAFQIGRTHGIHAEPITFGLKLAIWWDELQRHRARFAAAAEELRVGKISGAVGTFAHIGPEAEEKICARLGLKAAPISSQVLSRDLHAHYIATLAGIAASLEKIALEIRHLQRTEVREAEEPFAAGQKGSSAMPHKRNPVTCEQICGLARVVRGNAEPAFENVALWHERDISHSSVERIILPDSTILIDYLLAKTTWLISGLQVNVDRMRRNIDLTRGLIFSGQLLLDLAAAGMLREDAYRLIQGHAMRSWEEDGDFRAAVAVDPVIQKHLTADDLDRAFSLERQLCHVDAVFARVFGPS
jgi:adenylosuccinate lyase